MLKVYNTLTKREEIFKPISKEVLLYTCGPTVYDYAHIGNLCTYVRQDMLKRYLEYKGFKVKHVMNLTDIDDKTIKNSEEAGLSLKEFTDKYTKAFFEDAKSLNIKPATIYVPATQEIQEMIKIVSSLIKKGFAYEKYGSVYFDITKFKDYGKLSGIDLSKMKVGATVDVDEYAKDAPQDFALFKRSSLQELKGGVFYEAPWGKSRPGWHIECSAIALKYLGETIDMHSGGVDLIFPHHENEIAQSEAYTGKQFCKYWIHMEHLLVNGQKMSKSLGNFFTLRDLVKKGYDPISVRYLFLSSHYKTQLNFTEESLKQAEKTVYSLRDFVNRLNEIKTGLENNSDLHEKTLEAKKKFEDAMDDDLNTPLAFSAIFDLVHATNKSIEKNEIGKDDIKEIYEIMKGFDSVLGILEYKKGEISDEIKALIEKREKFRKENKFKEADKIRKELEKKGIIVEDTSQGVRWKRKSS